MLDRLVAGGAADAAAVDFGRREAVHRSRRLLPRPVLWTVTGVAAALAVLAGSARLGVLAIMLVPLTLLGVGCYTFLLPPIGGRRWVVLYEHGLVQAVPSAGWTRAVRWDDVLAVDHGAATGDFELVLAPGSAPGPKRGWFAAFGDSGRLLAGLDRHVQPLAVTRAKAKLAGTGQVDFGGLGVTPAGLRRADDPDPLPWGRIIRHQLVRPGRLLVLAAGEQQFAWFDDRIPNAVAADRLIDELDPATATAGPAVSAEELVGRDLAADSERLRLGRRQARRSMAKLAAVGLLPALLYPVFATVGTRTVAAHGSPGATAPVASTPDAPATPGDTVTEDPPTPTPPPTPTVDTPADVFGYDKVCRGSTFPGAHPYAGRGPHPIEFADVSRDYLPDSDLPGAPPGWTTKDPKAVQLVACVTKTPGPVARSCYYRDLAQPIRLRWLDFSITIRTAGTGRQVARFRVRGQDTDCQRVIIFKRGEKPLPQYSTLTPGQLRSSFSRYVTRPVT